MNCLDSSNWFASILLKNILKFGILQFVIKLYGCYC